MRKFMFVAVAALAMSGCGAKSGKMGAVDDAALIAGSADGANWLSYGRTMDEQRFSPLTQVSDTNVAQLGLEWSADMDTARGQEATPIVVDGIMYFSTAWSMVKAYDAATGKLLWSYDPKVPREKMVDVCCDVVNRGVAVYKGKVYVGTIAGHLVALNADNGQVIWDVKTTPEGSPMTITGAPRIAKGKVLIGSAGAEYITRGYLAAYDAETGKEAWRFYTVPGDPTKPFEGKHLEAAAKTWAPDAWKRGGGGTVWDAITYDPETDLVYFGTANAEPWNPAARGSKAGDSLYTASIVAVKPDTGEYVWHFQETPEDRWDYDSNQQIIAATLPIDGKPTRVLLHAPKNGFFYVLDAKTGKYLSGKQFAKAVNWAKGLDANGKPIVNPEARYEVTGKVFIGMPGAGGAHSWTPMSYSPKTGLVYIPANEAGQPFNAASKDWAPSKVGFQTGLDISPVATPAVAQVRDNGFIAGVGPHCRQAALAGRISDAVEWRNAGDRRQSRLSGNGGRRVSRLCGGYGQTALVFPDADGRHCGADHLCGQGAAICCNPGWLGRGFRCGTAELPDAESRDHPEYQPDAGVQDWRQSDAARCP
jgi:quinohemoprotein ethanol dehydrogenase